MREAELKAALEVIGVSEHLFLGYRSDEFLGIDEEGAISRISGVIEKVQPDSILTHNGDEKENPQHTAVCSWTTEAFRRIAKPGARLFYATRTPEWVDRFVPPLREVGAFPMFEPAATREQELAINYVLPDDLLDLKLDAVEKHMSQVGFIVDRVGRDLLRESMREEHYRSP